MAVVGDIVVANILVSTLVSLAVEIDSRVKPGGKLLLSGILAGQESEVIDAFSECYQFTVQEEEGWILVEGDKEAP
jgi:ribosomal protein L11 methyltransferase